MRVLLAPIVLAYNTSTFTHLNTMKTKLNQVKEAYTAGDYKLAFRIASKFQDLGTQRNAILDAHLAITNPRWMLGLGKDIEKTVAAGLDALRVRYTL